MNHINNTASFWNTNPECISKQFPSDHLLCLPLGLIRTEASSVVWLAGYHIPPSSIWRYLDWKILITVLHPWVGFISKFEHLRKGFSNLKLLLERFVKLRFLWRDFRNSMQRGKSTLKKKNGKEDLSLFELCDALEFLFIFPDIILNQDAWLIDFESWINTCRAANYSKTNPNSLRRRKVRSTCSPRTALWGFGK